MCIYIYSFIYKHTYIYIFKIIYIYMITYIYIYIYYHIHSYSHRYYHWYYHRYYHTYILLIYIIIHILILAKIVEQKWASMTSGAWSSWPAALFRASWHLKRLRCQRRRCSAPVSQTAEVQRLVSEVTTGSWWSIGQFVHRSIDLYADQYI